ncbi:SHIKIMATE O-HYDROXYCINNAMOYLTRANSFERASE-LIKE [Salix koriyanagi]|uniref:SHIKIMATE O-HYDROXYCINNAMOYLTRANSFERASE-LIKE n=1 Tax=Salix koriyanagi TaxID=2511006 RepID=A0A9Q0W4R8_9ROSI|nr:SHIKIMATE O-HYDROXYCINNAMOYLTRANSFERASE-LIKE [Salix koriyanagi]
MVRPSSDTPNRILWSSDLDLLVPMFHVQTVYFYKPNGSSMFFETQVLKDALSDVLVPFYPAAGRMGKNDDGRIEIHSRSCCPLVPEVDYSGGISSYPLVVLQVSIALLSLRIICYCAMSYSYFMAPKIEFRRIFLSF